MDFHKYLFRFLKIVPRGTIYLPRYINKILISEGETPLILPAWPILTGLIFSNFCLPSVEIETNSPYSISSGIFKPSSLIIFSATTFSLCIYPSYFIFISADSAISLNLSDLAESRSLPPLMILRRELISTCGLAAIVIAFTFCESIFVPA
jgi:hypothetical protein